MHDDPMCHACTMPGGLYPYAVEFARLGKKNLYLATMDAITADAWRNSGYDDDVINDKADTICDLTAYCLMVVAAGIERISELKRRKRSASFKTRHGDHLDVFGSGDRSGFSAAINEWAALPNAGAMQVKFGMGQGDRHTFMVERTSLDPRGLKSGFRIYQAFQGTYTLAEQLGLVSAREGMAYRFGLRHKESDAFKLTGLDWDTEPEDRQAKGRFAKSPYDKWKTFKDKCERDVQEQLPAVSAMCNAVGCGKTLTADELSETLIGPMQDALAGGALSASQCMTLTGYKSKGNVPISDCMLLRCDTVDVAKYEQHFRSLRPADHSGGFIAVEGRE